MNFCIHGHFYQPPREEPISNNIPNERGASPYKNWNERICAECYTPNALAGNFEKISFNIGPTLFSWMFENVPETAKLIVEQENVNFNKYGVGNGMAQAYNHSILPLQSWLDKITQVRWGVEEFKYRFGHSPDGMWLAETGVDLETLCALSDCGLCFTILAPWQVKPLDGQNQSGPFLVDLPDGRSPFVVFTYDREISTKISFTPKATENGDDFLRYIFGKYNKKNGITVLASDGELYGHHQKFRDLFLTYILGDGASKFGIKWTYPALYLKENAVNKRAMLVEPSSWSCMHGVGRWSYDCGCTPGSEWKAPMREAINAIAEWVDEQYLSAFKGLNLQYYENSEYAWEMRHRYIDVMLGKRTVEKLGEAIFGELWKELDTNRIAILLEAQLERQRMFTSCGWFFDDFNRIEPANNIAYAAKAVWLCMKANNEEFDTSILDLLRKTNSPKTGLNAETIFLNTLERAEQRV